MFYRRAIETTALLAAPIAPFVAEMLYARLAPGRGSVHAQLLPEPDAKLVAKATCGASTKAATSCC